MYETVLLTTDGSERAAEALDHAINAANAYGAELHIVSVVDERIMLAAEADEKPEVRSELVEDAETAVNTLATPPADEDIPVTTATPEGVPYREIISYADDEGIDLIVIGTHGRTGREKRINLGSTTERVVKAAEQPVLVVNIS